MKERPILFSGPMVLALLAGTKTQTRRAAKLPVVCAEGSVSEVVPSLLPNRGDLWDFRRRLDNPMAVRCPYGQPGDRLWVRETWSPDPTDVDGWGYTAWAGCREGQIAGVPERFRHPRFCNYAADWLHGPIRWTPSIHMPRWASRITLEITSVRVERLQDISEADALAEGIAQVVRDKLPVQQCGEYDGIDVDPVDLYRDSWESINGPDSWDDNPWVWVVEFKPVATTR